jgi:prephenate dehydrogenase
MKEGGFARGQGPGRVAIVGAGQVGTMIGMALTAAGLKAGVDGVDLFDVDPSVAALSRERGAGRRVLGDLGEALSADTVIIAIPVPGIVRFLEEYGARLAPGSLVIDTGGAKAMVVNAMRRHVPPSVHAVGGHPMAGTEVPGPAGARSGLCAGAPFAIVPVRDDPEALARAHALALAAGSIPVDVDAETHDRIVARTSHLPHLVAFAVARVVRRGDLDGAVARSLASSGLAGVTRLAASDPTMVAGFLWANAREVRRSVAELVEALAALGEALDGGPEGLAEALAGIVLGVSR